MSRKDYQHSVAPVPVEDEDLSFLVEATILQWRYLDRYNHLLHLAAHTCVAPARLPEHALCVSQFTPALQHLNVWHVAFAWVYRAYLSMRDA
jgi:hypothetical protein